MLSFWHVRQFQAMSPAAKTWPHARWFVSASFANNPKGPSFWATRQHKRCVAQLLSCFGGALAKHRLAALAMAFADHGDELSDAHEGAQGGVARAKGVAKTYLAVVVGRLEGSGLVDAPVQGKRAISRWESVRLVFLPRLPTRRPEWLSRLVRTRSRR